MPFLLLSIRNLLSNEVSIAYRYFWNIIYYSNIFMSMYFILDNAVEYANIMMELLLFFV